MRSHHLVDLRFRPGRRQSSTCDADAARVDATSAAVWRAVHPEGCTTKSRSVHPVDLPCCERGSRESTARARRCAGGSLSLVWDGRTGRLETIGTPSVDPRGSSPVCVKSYLLGCGVAPRALADALLAPRTQTRSGLVLPALAAIGGARSWARARGFTRTDRPG